MTTRQAFLDDLMLDAREDDLGFWEVAGLAQTAFPDTLPSEQLRAAKEGVRTLLHRGWIEVRTREDESRTWSQLPAIQRLVDPDAAGAALDNDRNWLEDWIRDASVRYFIHATERGNVEFREDLRRRGLWRLPEENKQM